MMFFAVVTLNENWLLLGQGPPSPSPELIDQQRYSFCISLQFTINVFYQIGSDFVLSLSL